MNNSETFYESIAAYYDYIFPLNEKAVSFATSYLNGGDKVLDIGCAVGSLSCELAKFCNQVEAFDLNAQMVAIAKQKSGDKVNFKEADMLQIAENYPLQYFDVASCFGNTLVHLLTTQQQFSFLQQVYQSLKKGGVFLLQILNYDTILDKGITQLPLIDNDKITFVRTYQFNKNESVFDFHTELKLKDSNRTITNKAQLFALRPCELEILLQKAGFSQVKMYNSFDREGLSEEKLPLVVEARKNL